MLFILLQRMKIKFPIINASLLAIVLFTILFQSIHFGEHLFKEYFNNQDINSHQTHLHHDGTTKIIENNIIHHTCSICEFTLSSILLSGTFSLKLFFTHEVIPYSFNIVEASVFFFENPFGLRAPPISIC